MPSLRTVKNGERRAGVGLRPTPGDFPCAPFRKRTIGPTSPVMVRPTPAAFDKVKTVAENRRARFDYFIDDKFEAGIMLTGTEVKSLRTGKAQITESYASPEDGELWLINAHIPEYLQANRFNHEERRRRKLLVSRKELSRLSTEVHRSGNTIVPLKLYFNERGMAKLLIGLAKGRKNYDKRALEANRDWNRDKARIMKEGGRG